MNLPFDPGELIAALPSPCIAFPPGAPEPWMNPGAQRLADENPDLLADLGKAMAAGQIVGRVFDLIQVGEVSRFLFEPVVTAAGVTVWMGWNVRNTLFSSGMELTQMIARKLTHEIRNPLQPIQIIADQWHDTHPEFASDAVIIRSQIDRILKVIEHLRRLLDMRPLAIQSLELNGLLDRLIGTLRRDAPAQISWSFHRMTKEIMIAGEADRLGRAMEYLIRNGLEAMPEGGCLQIATGICGSREQGGLRAYVEISDSGAGMSAEAMGQLFMPFFSTKKDGVGLGLVLARRIIEQHRGDLKFASQEGIGTTATVSLPPLESH
ncbi:MAG: ATP-binding protein [Candidatus Zixiibacteriota bacterium]